MVAGEWINGNLAGCLWGRRARRPYPQGDGGSPGRGAKKLYTEGDGDSQGAEAAVLKPPLPGEVARRSRDGGVSGLCCAAIIGYLPRIEVQPIEATPQALRASSTRRGMATHTQLKLRFAAHLAGEPKSSTRRGMATHAQLKLRFQSLHCQGRWHGEAVTEGLAAFAVLRLLAFFPGLEAPPSAATPQALRASSPSRGAKKLCPQGDGAAHAAKAAVRCSPGRGAKKLHPQGDGAAHAAKAAALKPPLLGEVARRSRDGGVGSLCSAAIPGFLSRTRSSAKCSNPSGAARQLP